MTTSGWRYGAPPSEDGAQTLKNAALGAMPRPFDALVKFHGCGRVWETRARSTMVSYFVRYRGQAADPHAFARYYENEHAGILRGFSNIRSLILHQPTSWNDPFPVHPDGTELLAQMTFNSAAD